MAELYTYRFDKQFEDYIRQFMRVFAGFQYVSDNQGTLTRIPVVFGPMERVIASRINKDNANFVNGKIPVIAVSLEGIEKAEDRKRPVDAGTYQTASINGNTKALGRMNGPVFTLSMQVNLVVSSMSQLFEVLEQILLIFNPRVTIQNSNDPKDNNYISSVDLDSIDNDITYPLGENQRTISLGLNFSFDAELQYPHLENEQIVEQIKNNIKDSTGDTSNEIDDSTIE